MSKKRSSKPTILICDDESSFSTSIARSLSDVVTVRRSFEIMAADPIDFKDAVTELERRRRTARDEQPDKSSSRNLIDRADVLIVDYDLIGVYDDSYLTGEVVAYLARCYSTCGVIIGVNQFGENSFDLTLTREASSYADFNVGARQLVQPGLWSTAFQGFKPWRWPNVLDALESKQKRERELKDAMGETIASFLGFRDTSTLPREMTEFLKVPGKSIDAITFRDFISGSSHGLRRKDQVLDGADVSIAASRLAKWLEDVVLPAQDVLVDAPHLVSRIPELLVGKSEKVETWNQTVATDIKALGIRHDLLKPFEFKRRHWLTRPAWFWRDLREAESIQKLRSTPTRDVPDYVFCEDISRFVPRAEAREFVAEVPSSFSRRYIADPKKIKLPSTERQFLSKVTYQPEVRLAL